jgi:hypothetical protein
MMLPASRLTSGFASSGARSSPCEPTSGTSRVLSERIAASWSLFFGRRTLHMSQMLRRHAWDV